MARHPGILFIAFLLPASASAQFPSFLKVQGRSVVDAGGKPVHLRGVAFGNEVWTDTRIPLHHHSEADFRRVAAMGMNVVRFYLNYKTFESDAKPYAYLPDGWAWLDSNIVWARRHQVYLILNMHVPQGGFQSTGRAFDLWNIRANQQRLKALWHAIAARYRDEPVLAGFDLLNEPGVPESRDQWKTLAQELVDTLRAADSRRMLIVERTHSVQGEGEDADRNLFLVRDANILYTFHFYYPFDYTHQFASWTTPPVGEGGKYPDTSRKAYLVDPLWAGGGFQNPLLPAGTTGWTFFSGAKTPADQPGYHLAMPVVASNLNSGKAWFDDLVLREFDAAGNPLRAIPLGLESTAGWHYWSEDGKGAFSRETAGCRTGACFRIEASSSNANANGNPERIQATRGHAYTLEGYMKGADVPAGARVQLRVDFETAPGGLHRRDRAYLAAQLESFAAWGRRHDVPLYLGEFGLMDSAFQGGRGGLQYVSDLLDLIVDHGIHFTYHTYHEPAFGIYKGSGKVDTSQANHGLIALFKQKLGSPSGLGGKAREERSPRRSRKLSPERAWKDPAGRSVDGRMRE